MMRKVTVLLAAGLLLACASRPAGVAPLVTVDELDLARYQGEWFVIANIPYFFERGKVAPRVIYRPRSDGRMDDLYFYREAFGEPEQSAEGLAWVPDPDEPGVLKTRFLWPFTFDYQVIKLDPEYRYTAIAHPSRQYAWIMAREPHMDESVYREYLSAFAAQGYDTELILKIPQRREQLGQNGFQGG